MLNEMIMLIQMHLNEVKKELLNVNTKQLDNEYVPKIQNELVSYMNYLDKRLFYYLYKEIIINNYEYKAVQKEFALNKAIAINNEIVMHDHNREKYLELSEYIKPTLITKDKGVNNLTRNKKRNGCKGMSKCSSMPKLNKNKTMNNSCCYSKLYNHNNHIKESKNPLTKTQSYFEINKRVPLTTLNSKNNSSVNLLNKNTVNHIHIHKQCQDKYQQGNIIMNDNNKRNIWKEYYQKEKETLLNERNNINNNNSNNNKVSNSASLSRNDNNITCPIQSYQIEHNNNNINNHCQCGNIVLNTIKTISSIALSSSVSPTNKLSSNITILISSLIKIFKHKHTKSFFVYLRKTTSQYKCKCLFQKYIKHNYLFHYKNIFLSLSRIKLQTMYDIINTNSHSPTNIATYENALKHMEHLVSEMQNIESNIHSYLHTNQIDN